MLLLLIILILLFGGGGGYYGHSRWGYGGGAGIGLGTVLLIVLVFYMVGGFPAGSSLTLLSPFEKRPSLTVSAALRSLDHAGIHNTRLSPIGPVPWTLFTRCACCVVRQTHSAHVGNLTYFDVERLLRNGSGS